MTLGFFLNFLDMHKQAPGGRPGFGRGGGGGSFGAGPAGASFE